MIYFGIAKNSLSVVCTKTTGVLDVELEKIQKKSRHQLPTSFPIFGSIFVLIYLEFPPQNLYKSLLAARGDRSHQSGNLSFVDSLPTLLVGGGGNRS